MIEYREFCFKEYKDTIKSIYEKESWLAYLRDDAKLERAFDNSLLNLGAFEGERLLGFVRCVGDGEHILLVQDLIVDRDFQKQGIGSMPAYQPSAYRARTFAPFSFSTSQ